MKIRFGPAGNGDSYQPKKETIPQYIVRMGLTAYEYQCGHGVRVTAEKAAALGTEAKEKGISLSLHSPYYISLSSVSEETRASAVDYILQSARAADAMGAERVVVHSGSCAKITREEALGLAKETLKNALDAMRAEGLYHIRLCPETMGKINQLGTLSEVLSLCAEDENLIPCIDFGHLNARTLGSIQTGADYAAILDETERVLGRDRALRFHSHFSKIEYTVSGGEKKHLTFEDSIFGPDFSPLAEELVRRNATPTIICESAGTQAEDARQMLELVRSAGGIV
ncbi:MAG: endonuclease IV [Ruminococcaceae bacterium]|nr:endonuclease IV [Oscillospiraceae bacterium]